MYIVQIASEIAPIAKVGGLADVLIGLSRELVWKGHSVDILLPKYDCLETRYLQFTPCEKEIQSYFKGSFHNNTIWTSPLNGDLKVTFIEPHHPAKFFERGQIYGCPDDNDRFLYFSRACLDYLKTLKQVPDVIHLHDWETAMVAALLKDPAFKEHFAKTKIVFTIHNLEYQGRCSTFNLDDIGYAGPKEKLLHPQSSDMNLMKAGIIYADAVTTVSPTYAKEIMTQGGEASKGLLDVLVQNKNKFCGILNGLDYVYWNPEQDRFLTFHYTLADLKAKAQNKWHLLEELGMQKNESKPLIVSIARLVLQKGVHLLREAVIHAKKSNAQYILLGTAQDPEIIQEFTELQNQFQKDPDIRIILKNEEALAHRLYAASDLFLVPSLFEPCGLTQMIALRYGSIPIVRKTGGLADTIVDVETSGEPFEKTNGFSFDLPDVLSTNGALDRAFMFWRGQRERWEELMRRGMQWDFSWKEPCKSYEKIYQQLPSK